MSGLGKFLAKTLKTSFLWIPTASIYGLVSDSCIKQHYHTVKSHPDNGTVGRRFSSWYIFVLNCSLLVQAHSFIDFFFFYLRQLFSPEFIELLWTDSSRLTVIFRFYIVRPDLTSFWEYVYCLKWLNKTLPGVSLLPYFFFCYVLVLQQQIACRISAAALYWYGIYSGIGAGITPLYLCWTTRGHCMYNLAFFPSEDREEVAAGLNRCYSCLKSSGAYSCP